MYPSALAGSPLQSSNAVQAQITSITRAAVLTGSVLFPIFEITKSTVINTKGGMIYAVVPNRPNITEDRVFPAIPPYPSSAIIRKTIAPKRTRSRISLFTSIALISSRAILSDWAFVILPDVLLVVFFGDVFFPFLLFVLLFALDEAIRFRKPSLSAANVRRR